MIEINFVLSNLPKSVVTCESVGFPYIFCFCLFNLKDDPLCLCLVFAWLG